MVTRNAGTTTGHGAGQGDASTLRAEMEGLRTRLEQADGRMAEVVARLAHELRSPLGAILMWAHVLRTGGDAERETAIDAIEAGARTQSAMIAELLDVARALSGRLRIACASLDLRDPLRMAIELAAPSVSARGIRLQVSTPDLPVGVQGDLSRLRDVVSHLIGNAIKFTPEGGTVDVALTAADGSARMVVRDSGCGIRREHIAGIFEAFRSSPDDDRRVVGGLGLGLAFVRLVVELHGGTATADSEGTGRGSTFLVKIPLMMAK